MSLYRCEICGNVYQCVDDNESQIMCCGQPMSKIEPRNDDSATGEKHVPIFNQQDNKVHVQVGSVIHPYNETHYIEWIKLITDKGEYLRKLDCCDEPKVCFTIQPDEEVQEVLAYCNIHGLWTNKK